jgi:arylsulfatase A-like enzyme
VRSRRGAVRARRARAAGSQLSKLNILVIFGDDVGYWNISAFHQGVMDYDTPNIDRLATEGGAYRI